MNTIQKVWADFIGTAGEDIQQGELVCFGEDGLIYKVENKIRVEDEDPS